MDNLINKLYELALSSAITQGTLSVLALGGSLVLLIQGHIIPEWLVAVNTLVIGYFFGTKTGIAQGEAKVRKDQQNASGIK